MFGRAGVGFLKVCPELDTYICLLVSNVCCVQTPNFVMVPANVLPIEQDPVPHNQMTLQYINPPMGLHTVCML